MKRRLSSDEETDTYKVLSSELLNRLYDQKEIVFTENMSNMIHQETSEVRAQVNYQLLLFTTVLAFIAVIGAALIGLIG